MLGCVAIHALVISPRREIETYFYHRIKIVGVTTLAGLRHVTPLENCINHPRKLYWSIFGCRETDRKGLTLGGGYHLKR